MLCSSPAQKAEPSQMLEVSLNGLSVPLTSWWSRLRTTGACSVGGHKRSATSVHCPAQGRDQGTGHTRCPSDSPEKQTFGGRKHRASVAPMAAQRRTFRPPGAPCALQVRVRVSSTPPTLSPHPLDRGRLRPGEDRTPPRCHRAVRDSLVF